MSYGPQYPYHPQHNPWGYMPQYPGYGQPQPPPQQPPPAGGAVPANDPPGVQSTPQLPPNYDGRFGNVQGKPVRHYDTLLYGIGQVLSSQGEELFTNNNRINNRFLCSLKEQGKFSDKNEYHARALGLTLDFENPNLFELFHYQLISYKYKETTKWRIWADQIGAGGGTWGYDVNAGAFVKNWGSPDTNNVHHLDEELLFSVQRTFNFFTEWMELTGVAANNQPLAILNAADTVKKLYRFFMIGYEIGDESDR